MHNFFLILTLLYTTLHQSIFVEPVWVTSNYFRAGNEAVINSLTGSSVTPMYTFTFSSALPGIPNLGYGIKNYEGTLCIYRQAMIILANKDFRLRE